jgi:Cof subfamily protein (haloacid dehalogenase superfamily)
MEYRLLALDMDGTVLTSNKVISPRTEVAIQEALEKGKEVLFATGRCPSEMTEYIREFPAMKYAMCLSGALIFDVKSGQPMSAVTISRELAEQVLDLAGQLDAMVNIYAGPDVFVEKRRRGNMEYFNCQCFAALYDDCAVWVDDIRTVLDEKENQIYKINLYCHDQENWEKGAELLKELPLNYASGIPMNFEISPPGVNKGMGLETLCRVTGIPLSEMIAVGDEGNDLEMIKMAGLGVAMGNASDAVIEVADAMTADCDHDGVAEVIKHCLL